MAPALPIRARQLLRWTATEFVDARRAGTVTCEEYTRVLVDRMLSLRDAQQFMQTTYGLADQIVAAARDMDLRAAASAVGVEVLAPLFCLPVPVKGTLATMDFPSSAGHALLDHAYARRDAAFITLLRRANAVVMGKTNVPEFAASSVTMNPVNGRTMNLYDGALTSGGSSGGSGSAVAAHVAPIAITEDTGGSTRHPAFQNHVFGYDPTRNHYPNKGNPGLTYTNDQVGLNARSFADILLVDAALCGTGLEHVTANATARQRRPADIRVGLPLIPFVDLQLPGDAYNFWGVRNATTSTRLRAKYEAAKRALSGGGYTLVEEEWPAVESAYFGRTVNAALDTLFGNRRINNRDYDGVGAPHVHSFTGQIAEWARAYLGSHISLQDIWEHSPDGGDGHSPRGFYNLSTDTDESQARAAGHVQAEKLRVWNSYFDQHGVDVIMTPGQLCDAISYTGMADSSLPLRARQPDGSYREEGASVLQCNLVAYWAFKDIPVPKVRRDL